MFKKIKNMSIKHIIWEVLLLIIYISIIQSFISYLIKKEILTISIKNISNIALVALFFIGIFGFILFSYLINYLVANVKMIYNDICNINNTIELKLYKELEKGVLKSNYSGAFFIGIGIMYLAIALYFVFQESIILIIILLDVIVMQRLIKKEQICETSYHDNFTYIIGEHFNDAPELSDNKNKIEFLKKLKFEVEVRYVDYVEVSMNVFKIGIATTGFLYTTSLLEMHFVSGILPESTSENILVVVIIFVISFLFAILDYIYKILINRRVIILSDLDKYIANLEEKEKETQNLKEIENMALKVTEDKPKEVALAKQQKEEYNNNKIQRRRNRR